MIDSIINSKNVQEADCIILTAPYDRTSSLGKGASKGTAKIIKCLEQDVEFFDRYNKIETAYHYKIFHQGIKISNELLPEEMVVKIRRDYLDFMRYKKMVVLLGGDHSVSSGVFEAISQVENPSEITIFQIDAHCDLRNDDENANPDQSHISKYAHSCVMRRAFDCGFNIVQVGIRSYAKEEYDFIRSQKRIKVFEWGGTGAPSISKLISSINTKKVYISLDVDGLDPAHMPATGTPVPGGLEWYYTVKLLNELIQKKEVIGIDIVEVAPIEGEELTQFAAAQICYYMIGSCLIKNKK